MNQPALTSINPAVLQNKNKANWLKQSGMYTRFQEYTWEKLWHDLERYGVSWDRILKEICTRGKAYKNRKDWIAARMNRFLCK